jgi:hypothetical protein
LDKKIIGLSLILLLAFMLLGCTGSSGTVKATDSTGQTGAQTNTTTPSVQTQTIENGVVGTTYQVEYSSDKFEVTLTKTAFEKSTNPYMKGNYLMAYFEIRNIGTKSAYIMPKMYIIDSTQEKIDNTFAIGLSDEYSKTLDWVKQLSPNTKSSGWVAFEVPEGTTTANVYFDYSNAFDNVPKYIKYTITQ